MDDIARNVRIPADGLDLDGELQAPPDPRGVVLFVHGSGSSRSSPRNRFVAEALRRAGMATVLLDLLTPTEDHALDDGPDVARLAERAQAAVGWTLANPPCARLPVGIFAAGTGAAAAIEVADALAPVIACLVCRGGRLDLACPVALQRMPVPTLMVVGSRDTEVLAACERAMEQMRCRTSLAIVPGASHLFIEKGALASVATLATEWFERHLVREETRAPPPTQAKRSKS